MQKEEILNLSSEQLVTAKQFCFTFDICEVVGTEQLPFQNYTDHQIELIVEEIEYLEDPHWYNFTDTVAKKSGVRFVPRLDEQTGKPTRRRGSGPAGG